MLVSEVRVGPSLVWASPCQEGPCLPSLAASGSSDTTTLYPGHQTRCGLAMFVQHMHNFPV